MIANFKLPKQSQAACKIFGKLSMGSHEPIKAAVSSTPLPGVNMPNLRWLSDIYVTRENYRWVVPMRGWAKAGSWKSQWPHLFGQSGTEKLSSRPPKELCCEFVLGLKGRYHFTGLRASSKTVFQVICKLKTNFTWAWWPACSWNYLSQTALSKLQGFPLMPVTVFPIILYCHLLGEAMQRSRTKCSSRTTWTLSS